MGLLQSLKLTIWPPRELRWPRRLVVVLGILWLVSLGYLLTAESPWGPTVSKHVAAGDAFKTEDYRIIGLWVAAVLDLAIATLLLLTGRFWWGEPPSLQSENGQSRRGWRAFFLLILAAVVFGGIARAPRLSHGLWNDEEYAFRRYVGGDHKQLEDGSLQYRPVSWEKAICFNHSGNNHILHTVLARISHGTWKAVTDAEEDAFSESALRLFPYLWGLGAIGLAGLLGRRLGGPALGIAAAWMLALSPWHVRYSVEARGYSLMLFLLLLMVLLIERARRREDGWGWWFGAALAGGLSILAFGGTLYALVPVWVIALFGAWRRGMLLRPVAANLIALALCIPGYAPSIPQVAAYLNRDDIYRFTFGVDWVRDILSHLAVGLPPGPLESGLQEGPDLHSLGSVAPALVFWGVPILIAIGSAVLLKRSSLGRTCVGAFVASFFLVLGVASLGDSPVFSWYLFFSLPALTVVAPASALLFEKVHPQAVPSLLGILVVGFGILTHIPRRDLAAIERQTMRAAIHHVRESAPEAITGVFGTSDRQSRSYDPASRLLATPDDLAALEREAISSDLPLYLYFCGGRRARERDPDLVAEVVDSGRYSLEKELLAFEELYSYKVFAFQPDRP